jgi:ribose-phosphate pyrophosphokinase
MRTIHAMYFFFILLVSTALYSSENSCMLFTGNASTELAQKIADYLQIPLGAATVTKFSDGEIKIHIHESVRGKDIFIVQSGRSHHQSVNDNLMELYLLIRTMKRASAKRITAIIPYYGYARQDRRTTSRVPISAADIALMFEMAGVDRLITIDLHCGQIQGFFQNTPVDNLFASSLFVSHMIDKNLSNVVVVSPDTGGIERVRRFAEGLQKRGVDAGIALISKERVQSGVISNMQLIGNVEGADAIIVDDMCDTAGTLVKAAQLIKAHGANRVFAVVTHPVFSGDALEKIKNSVIEELVISDTIALKEGVPSNIHCISVAPLLGQAILRVQTGQSISMMFE